jgi:RimJ/RimL family protein N-acetyltransferase
VSGPGAGPAGARTTERLLLRRWTEADRPAFAAMNADPAVMEHLPDVLDRPGSDVLLDRVLRPWEERGIGLWAVERLADGRLLGWAGLNPMPAEVPAAGEWEVGWRLVREVWGHGYATEAAREALQVARERAEPRVWSMTVPANVRSVAVMRRLGMVFDRTFDHPRFPPGHRLRAHVLYRLDLISPTA